MSQIFLLLLVLRIHNIMGAKILAVFPVPMTNEHKVYVTLIQELADRGHEITVVTSELAFPKTQESENIKEINLHDVSYKVLQNYSSIIESNQKMDFVFQMNWILSGLNSVFFQQLHTVEMDNLINEKNAYFDLLLLEGSIVSVLSLSHVFKVPVILVSAIGAMMDNYAVIGAPTHPFLYPSSLSHRIYNLTFWEKVTMLYTHKRLEAVFESVENKIQLNLNTHFADFPSLHELKNNVDMLFLNVNPIWAGSQPVPPNVVFMGGIQPKIMEELSEDWLSFLDQSRNGVIYVNFGDTIKPSLLPPRTILVILNVLSELPYNILLKWDVDALPGLPKNIKLFKSLPQLSVLKHQNIKLFVTNGGLQSTDDAINAGVPLVGIPMFADQWYNTEKYVHFGIGIQVNFESITEKRLIRALRTVIADESYKRNIIKLRTLMHDQPQSPLERAIWWTEHVLRHGGAKHLRAPAANMSWAEYYELRFVFMLLVVLCTIFVLLIVFVMIGFRFILVTFAETKKKMS